MGDAKGFRKRLAEAIQVAGLTQADLARELGVDRARVSNWVAGAHMPSAEHLLRLPAILGVDGHWLLTGEGGMKDVDRGEREQAYEEIVRIVLKTEKRE